MRAEKKRVRLGYACINLSVPTKLRTTRLKNATPERVVDLARGNLEETLKAARWNAQNGVGLLRFTSDMVPFATHPDLHVPWREALKEDFARVGEAIRATGQRVSTHPGQYSVLNSPRADVVEAAVRDLAYHADMLDAMGLAGDMVVHVGGAYGDRDAARVRFVDTVRALPANVRRRLVVENDDVTWNAGEVLGVSRQTGLPVVFDVFHDRLLPTPGLDALEALRRALATWPAGRTPKVHYSDPAPAGRRGLHGDVVDPVAFGAFVERTRGLRAFDVMVEAKRKDLAVLPLLPVVRRALASAPPEPAPVAGHA